MHSSLLTQHACTCYLAAQLAQLHTQLNYQQQQQQQQQQRTAPLSMSSLTAP
jgi:hypothetical protein